MSYLKEYLNLFKLLIIESHLFSTDAVPSTNEAQVSVGHLLSAMQQQQVNQSEDGRNPYQTEREVEVPYQQESQASSKTVLGSDDEDVPEKLKKKWVCEK